MDTPAAPLSGDQRLWLWDAAPRCGVSGSFQRAQAAAGTLLIEGRASSARVEAAWLTISTVLERVYERTGLAWRARRTEGGAIRWEPLRDSPELAAYPVGGNRNGGLR